MNAHEQRDDLISIEQAAEQCGVSLDTIRRRVAAGELPVFIDGRDRRRRLVSSADLNNVIKPRRLVKAA